MSTPGETLRGHRESRGKTIEEMADATGIGRDFLAALEQDAFDALPGRAFGKLYIRAYAEVLGFDPRPVLDAYDLAHNARSSGAAPSSGPQAPRPVEAALARWRRERLGEPELEEEPEPEADEPPEEPEPELEEPAEEPAVPEPELDPFEARWASERWEPAERVVTPEPEPQPEPEPEPKPIPAQAAPARERSVSRTQVQPYVPAEPLREHPGFRRWPAVAAALLLVLLVVAGVNAFRSKNKPVEPAPIPAPPVEVPKERPASPPPPVSAQPQPVPWSRLTVSDFGIGEGNRFRTGERVTFTTRVLGGRSGERIRHVWMRDQKVEQAIWLPLGASTWRTHSTKTLGRSGAWAVEARDEQGNVLARADFTCVP